MEDRLKKPYEPSQTEDRIYRLWEESGFFAPEAHPPWVDNPETNPNYGKRFSMVLPPPNATGVLHLGHTLEDSLQDTMVRYNRMKGFKALWLPGTDHAAIATDSKVTKILEKEGVRKKDIGREKFLKRVDEFVEHSRKVIVSQLRKIGASLDWSREAFTLDEERNLAVRTAFKRMYDDGLIYRGHRIVNWDPKGQTVISDDELVYEERKGKFYTFKYGPFEIGTARPETKFGDKYVVMHPDDARYKDWQHGQKLSVEWINGPIEATVIKDEIIDMEFGTGVMTITPSHSHEDFALAEKYKLDREQIIDQYGKLLPIAAEFAGMKIGDAREKIVEKLKSKGLLVSVDENYTNRVATAERTGGLIEPQIMLQWFVDVNKKIPARENLPAQAGKTLKELMLEPVQDRRIKIIPDHFERVYFNWIENLRDWCISRQIWYGHRIPVWYRNSEIYCGIEPPVDSGPASAEASAGSWVQDEDTLDTWFSSGLWTFSTLGWPEDTLDLKNYHPTDVINPGYEILFFWVARMILMSQYLLGDIPFRTVYLHGILRDAQGRKFSKSLGNGVDPLEVIGDYGADALRMSMIVGIGPGADGKFDIGKVKAYSKFANKLWNIARFILENTEGETLDSGFEERNQYDESLRAERQALLEDVTQDMDHMRFYLAAEKLYHYVWHTLADKIIEESKEIFMSGSEEERARRRQFLLHTLDQMLRALHPFMPFVTEEIWQIINARSKTSGLLLVQPWPHM